MHPTYSAHTYTHARQAPGHLARHTSFHARVPRRPRTHRHTRTDTDARQAPGGLTLHTSFHARALLCRTLPQGRGSNPLRTVCALEFTVVSVKGVPLRIHAGARISHPIGARRVHPHRKGPRPPGNRVRLRGTLVPHAGHFSRSSARKRWQRRHRSGLAFLHPNVIHHQGLDQLHVLLQCSRP